VKYNKTPETPAFQSKFRCFHEVRVVSISISGLKALELPPEMHSQAQRTTTNTSARGLVVKHADAHEVRVIVAAVLAVAADAVLVAKIPSKLGTNMVAVLAPACAQSRVKKQPRGGENAV
jgi:hypothetical protein